MPYNPQIHHRRSIRLKGYDYRKAGAYFITICCYKMECRFGQIVNATENVGASLAGAHFTNAQIVTPGLTGQNPNTNLSLQHIGGRSIKGASVKGAPAFDATIPMPDVYMQLNEYGAIAYNEWRKLPERFANVELDVFQIMPNHMHGIIVLTDTPAVVGAGFTPAQITNPEPTQETPTDKTDNTPTRLGDIIGAYKSLVANACLDIYKSYDESMGKLWHRNFYEHIIRNQKSYNKISNYIINNPSNWKADKFYAP